MIPTSIEPGKDLGKNFSTMVSEIENKLDPLSQNKRFYSRSYSDFRTSSLLAQFHVASMYELSAESSILGIEYSVDVDQNMRSKGVIAKIAFRMQDGDEEKLCRVLIVHKKFENLTHYTRGKLLRFLGNEFFF